MGRSGITTWLIQRATAVYLGVYALFVFIFLFRHAQLEYAALLNLWTHPFMQFGTLVALIGILLHAWIGLNIVLTDYVKVTAIRVILQLLLILTLAFYVVWGIFVLWGH